MAKGKRKSKTPDVIKCPAWCERGQDHDTPSDIEHWTSDRDISPGLSVSASQSGGIIIYEVRLSDHAKVELNADHAARLIAGLSGLLANTSHRWTKRVELTA